MDRDVVSQARIAGSIVKFREKRDPHLASKVIVLDMGGTETDLPLDEIRALKQALALAEARLLLRQEEQWKQRNYTLALS